MRPGGNEEETELRKGRPQARMSKDYCGNVLRGGDNVKRALSIHSSYTPERVPV